MVSVRSILSLMRIHQWYKNVIIFVPVLFSTLVLDPRILLLTLLGFISMSLAASGNYVLNDIIDVRQDRLHPEKRNRPIASGKVSIFLGIFLAVILYSISIWLALSIGIKFLYVMLFFILFTFAYSMFLKNIVFVDILAISTNFVLRAFAIVPVLDKPVTPWLIICPFFLALFLALGKRASDSSYLGKKASSHRKVLADYTPELTNSLLIISTTLLLISYTFYVFMSQHSLILVLGLPFAIYLVFHYYSLLKSGSDIPRHPQRAFRDWRIIVGMALWAIVTLLGIYGDILLSILA